jgi:hypothetical protein
LPRTSPGTKPARRQQRDFVARDQRRSGDRFLERGLALEDVAVVALAGDFREDRFGLLGVSGLRIFAGSEAGAPP